MTVRLEIFSQALFARNAAKQGAGCEVHCLRVGQRLAVRIFLDFRQVIPRIRRGVAIYRIIIKYANEIGSASCRERMCQYVSITALDVSLKKKDIADTQQGVR